MHDAYAACVIKVCLTGNWKRWRSSLQRPQGEAVQIFFPDQKKTPQKTPIKRSYVLWIQWPMVLFFSQCAVSSQSQLRRDMILRGLHLHK